MAEVDELVDRWRDAGIIDDDIAERIRAYELTHDNRGGAGRPGIFEALIYVGLAVIGVGAFVLMALLWGELATWARIVVTLLPGAGALGLGYVMYTMPEPGMKRGGSVAWVLAAALLTGCVGVVMRSAGWDDPNGALVTAIFAVAISLVLWTLLPWHPQLTALGAAMGFFSIALGARSDSYELGVFSAVLVALSLAWIALAELGLLKPRATARPLGALALAGGAYVLGFESDWTLTVEFAAFFAGAALVILSILRGSFAYMVFGIGVLFLAFVTFTMQRVPDPIVGALVLMLAGVLLVAAVLILARWKPWQHGEAAA